MPLSWERRHIDDEMGWFKRPSGAGPPTPPPTGLLLESDTGEETAFLLLESDTGEGTAVLLLENAE